MKLTTLTMAVAAACAFAQSAQARAYHHRAAYHHGEHHYARGHAYRHYARRHGHAWRYAAEPGSRYAGEAAYQGAAQQPGRSALRRTAYRGGYGGRPRAWCGWEMRHLVGADPGPQYNLARNWAHWGRSGAPGVGAVVVWAHHVGKIVGQENGQWIIQSGNDGHAVRTRPRSIAGAIAIRWG
jgi:hypothetical protein